MNAPVVSRCPIDPRCLPVEDLLRWHTPSTPLEEALAARLVEVVGDFVDEYELTEKFEELEGEIIDLKNERDEYKEFYDAVESAFRDSGNGYWPGASPTDEAFVAAVDDQLRGNAETTEALEAAARLIELARQYFPKSIQHSDLFTLENTCAAIKKALRHD